MLLTLRAEALHARAAALGLLAVDYGRKVADARARFSGSALVAALSALRREHVAAERALVARLSEEARSRRRAALADLRRGRKEQGARFAVAAGNTSNRASQKRRPRKQRRPRHKGPSRRT